jgi:CRP-like cAMP-binding protein
MHIGQFRRYPRTQSFGEIPLFSGCSKNELRNIASLTTELCVPTGRILTVTGDPGAEFFVIKSGTATVWRRGVILDTLGPGSFFGELSLFDHGVRTATVMANTDMRLLVMSQKEFRSSHFMIPAVLQGMLSEIGARLSRADEAWVAHTGYLGVQNSAQRSAFKGGDT